MSDIAIAKTVVLVLFCLALLSLFISLVRRELDNILRSFLFSLIFLGLFLFFQNTKMERLTFSELKKELGLQKAPQYPFIREEGGDVYTRFVRFTFLEPGPRLNLTIDPSGKYLHISNVEEINKVLEYIGLKKVTHDVPELASITGSQLDVNLYRWDDYPDGVLVLERMVCRDRRAFNTYPCILSITLTRRI